MKTTSELLDYFILTGCFSNEFVVSTITMICWIIAKIVLFVIFVVIVVDGLVRQGETAPTKSRGLFLCNFIEIKSDK